MNSYLYVYTLVKGDGTEEENLQLIRAEDEKVAINIINHANHKVIFLENNSRLTNCSLFLLSESII